MLPATSADVINDQVLSGIGALLSGMVQMIEPVFPVVGMITMLILAGKWLFGRRRPR
jgi:hypothetical protein